MWRLRGFALCLLTALAACSEHAGSESSAGNDGAGAPASGSGGLAGYSGTGTGGTAVGPRLSLAFEKTEPLSLDGIWTEVAVADFDGDAHLDVVAASDAHRLHVFMGRGDGTFAEGPKFDLAEKPASVTAADFDGDGSPDAVVALHLKNELAVFRGIPDGTLEPAPSYELPGLWHEPPLVYEAPLVLSDVDGDGLTDFVLGTPDGVHVHRGGARGGFSSSESYPLVDVMGLALADFDCDGRPDLVVAANPCVVFLRTADGTAFARPVELAGYGGPAVADFDADGDLDVAFDGGYMNVHLNDGAGHFSALDRAEDSLLSRTFYMTETVVADFDRDGLADLALSSTAQPGLLLGLGDGWFEVGPGLTFASYSMKGGDFDEDGLVDLVSTTRDPPHADVWLNRAR